MATKKTTKKTARKVAVKKVAARAAAKPGAATKPARYADDPGRRYRELILDRRFGSEGKSLSKFRLAAVAEKAGQVEFAPTPITPGASNWVPLGPTAIPNGQTYSGARVLVTGRVTAIVVDPVTPNTMYVAAARGGVWKTLDGGTTWAPKSDNEASLAIGALAMAPSNNNRLYAGTGEGNIYYYAQTFTLTSINEDYHGSGVLRSDDGANTWTRLGLATFTGAAFYRIAVHPTNPDILLAATTFGLHRSMDGGTTWVQMTNGLPPITTSVLACTDVVYDPGNPSRAYCAFWGSGIYRTANANVANPTWTKLTSALPTTNLGRISLAVAPSNNAMLYALLATIGDAFLGVYTSPDNGTTWTAVPTGGVPDVFGAYTSNIAVDVSTPDVIYVSGVELYKGVKSGAAWAFTNVGGAIHADSHAFASHPANHLLIYSGNDGGIYRSTNGGTSWDDSINEGLCITQFEFIGQHPNSDTVVIGGTQDNGTEMFRNHPVFYHSADGDGGFAGIDPTDPRNMIHTFYNPTPERSTQAGKFGSYASISSGLALPSLFYPPWTYDDTNSNRVAFGTDRIKISNAQGVGGWPETATLPSLAGGRVSALHFVNGSLIYAATSNGLVYKVVKTAGTWTATLISAAPLPVRWIWDVQLVPGTADNLVVAMAGYGTQHVWKGVLTSGTWVWTAISSGLPDVPVNSLQIEQSTPATMYVGTDVGVYRTTSNGASWSLFNEGLPNVAVYDIKIQPATRVLRAATHGRGLWERKLDATAVSDVRLVVRDNIMDTGRVSPSPGGLAAFEDPLRQVNLNDPVYWWQCADIKVDAPVGSSYQMPVSAVDYLAFEAKLAHRDPQRGKVNRVYVQVHNRGVVPASNVVVKILYADASPGLPDLPADFWTAFPGNSSLVTPWTPVGAAQTIPVVSPTRPEIVEWDWTPPVSTATHSCMLAIVSCADDPITNHSLPIGALVPPDRHAGLKNLHVIDPTAPFSAMLRFYARSRTDAFEIDALPAGWTVSLLLSKSARDKIQTKDFKLTALTATVQKAIRTRLGDAAGLFDLTAALTSQRAAKLSLTGIDVLKGGVPVGFVFKPGLRAVAGTMTLTQRAGEKILGGNTFVLRPK